MSLADDQCCVSYTYTLTPGLYVIRDTGSGAASKGKWFAVLALIAEDTAKGSAAFLGRDDAAVTLLRAGDGGETVVKIDRHPATLYVTELGVASVMASERRLVVKLLDRDDAAPLDPSRVGAPAEQVKLLPVQSASSVSVSISAHSEGVGESVFPGGQWAGQYDTEVKLDGFSIALTGDADRLGLEYRVGNAQIGMTNWVKAGKYCGTRGKGVPLTAFAVRLTGGRADEFEVSYCGHFIGHGNGPVVRNGEACQSPGNQPLAAIFVEVLPAEVADQRRVSKRDLVPDDFDESEYLRQHPDVATAVSLGEIPSGYHHFLLHGEKEGRKEPRRGKRAK